VPLVVLIAPADRLPVLKDREAPGEALTFADTEALRALEAITRQRPPVVVLERQFAATSRGTALINRIRADPSLSACEIRVVAHDAGPAAAPAPSGGAPAATAAVAAALPAVAAAPPMPQAPLDQRGTRRAPRFKMAAGLDVQVDGNSAALVELSIVGAQVVSATILRPNQRIRVTLPTGGIPLRISGAVAWASFEIPKGGVRYRAGIEFLDADAAALTRFIEANKA
jgi:CheY-like chemotaxis protein